MDTTLSGITTPGQSEPRSDGSEVVLCFPPNVSITGASPANCLVYRGHSLRGSYSFIEMQSVYSTVLVEWDTGELENQDYPDNNIIKILKIDGWLVGFYGISIFVGYLMPNPFLYK